MMIPYTAPYSTWNIIKITNSKQGDQLMSDPKKYFVWEVYFCQKKYIFDPERSTNRAKKLIFRQNYS